MNKKFSSELALIKAFSYFGSHINNQLKGKAWVGHTPFAYWLVLTIKPKILVELGTHGGGSFFSFCQSVLDNGLDTRTYAVDTWQGEKHAGFYSETVFEEVFNFNKNHFASFSTLMRMKFDEAATKFEDGTIDLLHIDGFHSYDAVKNDFNTYHKKLSKDSVVLFHDTNEFKQGFGVHQFWNELKNKWPSRCFEFKHSHGLGVFFPNSSDAATNFKNELILDLEKFINIFTIIGDEIYYKINGRYSLAKNIQLNLDQLLGILKKVKNENPQAFEQIKTFLK